MVARVKICGLTRKSDVDMAISLGADALGFIFGYNNSPRNLAFAKLKELTKDVPPYVATVVVSPAKNPKLEKVIEEVMPTYLQLYDEEEELKASYSKSNARERFANFSNIIQTVRPSGQLGSIAERCAEVSKTCKAILLDSSLSSPYDNKIGPRQSKNRVSKSNQVQQWKLCRKVREALYPFPLILAGGLNERNVRDAVKIVRPYAVDVSSGVELRPGIKDEKKLIQFIQNAKSA